MRTTTPAPPPPSTTTRHYRPELQGLRGLAAGLVVVYHVWLDRVSGGVDVFFLVTGFLLTAQLVRGAPAARWTCAGGGAARCCGSAPPR